MKKITSILIVISLFHQFADAQWVQQVSGVSSGFQDCDFINENTGWICGNDGVILKTTNGGLNWFQQTSGVLKVLWGIEAIDANLLWCAGQWNTLLKSTNGGVNWQIFRDSPTSTPNFYKPYFINANTGWILKNNYILRTTNGGITFDSTNTVFTFLWDIYFKDAFTGVLCGDGSRILKSTDGGVVWNIIPVPLHQGGQPDFYRLTFIGNTGWVVAQGSSFGLGKLVYRTIDFGSTWDTIARVLYPIGEENYSVFFANINTGYCGGTSGFIFKTTNGGFNWYQQNVPINGYRSDFWFANDTLGWTIGGGGYILKTTNGGTYVGIQPVSSILPDKFRLYQNYPNPFNPITNVKFQMTKQGFVTLKIYDILGKDIKTLINEEMNAGIYEIKWDASEYPSGVYYYKLETNQFTDTKKMILIK